MRASAILFALAGISVGDLPLLAGIIVGLIATLVVGIVGLTLFIKGLSHRRPALWTSGIIILAGLLAIFVGAAVITPAIRAPRALGPRRIPPTAVGVTFLRLPPGVELPQEAAILKLSTASPSLGRVTYYMKVKVPDTFSHVLESSLDPREYSDITAQLEPSAIQAEKMPWWNVTDSKDMAYYATTAGDNCAYIAYDKAAGILYTKTTWSNEDSEGIQPIPLEAAE